MTLVEHALEKRTLPGFARRALVRAPRFLLGFALISLGSILVPYIVGVVPVLIGLALILPKEPLGATLHTAGVAHHQVGDPTGPAGVVSRPHPRSITPVRDLQRRADAA